MIETNPVLVRCWRGDGVESLHRGTWVVTNTAGNVLHGAGDPHQLVFGRSSTKSFQALPLIESGAADAFKLPTESIAVALASHSGEPQHEAAVSRTLELIGLDADALQCGPQAPMGSATGAAGSRIDNNCSGKHAGFLAVSQHLGADPADYLNPAGQVQTLVRDALTQITGADPNTVTTAIDGCSAPTFRLPLQAMATGIARITNPELAGLPSLRTAACKQLTNAAAQFPELVAGSKDRICTDLIKASNGRLFAKIGAEGVYFVGVVGGNLGLAVKIDDGNMRAFSPLLTRLLRRFDLLSEAELLNLAAWSSDEITNWDGLVVGRFELSDAVTA